ncbi:DUF4362 domain-containing protein [Paenibacillus lemnae]|uniref:DUF4362 domain-containing protein n=1 Tax=Paenibacillus lemnae TaxID=1330551 RepID=A0A848MC03_PAELE|nr:DUF4362 domain-containing protein [Paenibacillus lemnae]NMO97711.1 DUF4362 domain-containing protein [Paenibacillus lemnae]
MKKYMLTLTVALVLLSGCNNKSSNPSDNSESPFPAVSEPYRAEQAAENGDVVGLHGVTYNLDKWTAFLANLDTGVRDQVRITQYTDEGDPIFYELVYDGTESILYTFDNSMDSFGSDAGRPSTVCRDIELEENKEIGSHYKLTGCDYDTSETFWFMKNSN